MNNGPCEWVLLPPQYSQARAEAVGRWQSGFGGAAQSAGWEARWEHIAGPAQFGNNGPQPAGPVGGGGGGWEGGAAAFAAQ